MAEKAPQAQVEDTDSAAIQPKGAAAAGPGESAENLTAMQITALNKLMHRMDSSGISDYVRLMQNTRKVLWLNFLSGIARGLGFTAGTAVVLAIAYKVISHLIKMNIPYLTDMLLDLVEIIQGTPVQ